MVDIGNSPVFNVMFKVKLVVDIGKCKQCSPSDKPIFFNTYIDFKVIQIAHQPYPMITLKMKFY